MSPVWALKRHMLLSCVWFSTFFVLMFYGIFLGMVYGFGLFLLFSSVLLGSTPGFTCVVFDFWVTSVINLWPC